MKRLTIVDLAKACGASVATVNRVLSGSASVSDAMRQRVKAVAEEIGFYGVGAIQSRILLERKKFRFGFLLHQPTRVFYRELAQAIRAAAAQVQDCDVSVQIEFLEDLSPQNTAARMRALAENCDAIGVVAAVHPLVTQAVSEIQAAGIAVFGLISQLSASGDVHYIGLDNWKLGRMAAWTLENVCKKPGKLAIFVGNYRYRCQEMNEAGFRSYFREYAPEFTILEPMSTFESSVIAQEMMEKLLLENPDIEGVFVAGGGISGALTALRQHRQPGEVAVIAHQLMDVTRNALLDGYMSMAISNPNGLMAEKAIQNMILACSKNEGNNITTILPFDIFVRENI